VEQLNNKTTKNILMKMLRPIHLSACALFVAMLVSGCCHMGAKSCACGARSQVKRVGMVTQLRADKIDEYKQLHADSNAGVRDLLAKYHMHNFSIFLHQIDGQSYEFGYYEYTGDDFEGDMAKLDAEPRNKEWLKVCDPMQIPLPGSKGWTIMDRAYYNP
jgi:L-rhamnose mutarotase